MLARKITIPLIIGGALIAVYAVLYAAASWVDSLRPARAVLAHFPALQALRHVGVNFPAFFVLDRLSVILDRLSAIPQKPTHDHQLDRQPQRRHKPSALTQSRLVALIRLINLRQRAERSHAFARSKAGGGA